jgi:Glycosyltransferase family 87
MAYETLLFVPFSFLEYKAAYFAFLVFNLFLLAVSAVMLKPYISGLSLIGQAAPWALLFCFFPVGLALILGQDSLILLALMIGPFVLLERRKEFAAGFLLALGLFKFQFVIPIALLFLLWRQWKVLGGVLSGAALTIGVSVWITGVVAIRSLIRTLTTMSLSLATDAEKFRYGTTPELMPNIRGLICTLTGNSSGKGIAVATALCSAVLIAFAARKKPSFPLAIIVAVLVSYHGFINDTSLLALPVALALSSALVEGRTPALCAAAAVFVCPAVLFMLVGTYSWMVLPILVLIPSL